MRPRSLRTSLLLLSLTVALCGCSDSERGGSDGGSPPRDSAVPRDSASGGDGGAGSDASPTADAGSGGDAGGGSDDADVDLTFSGCSPDFSGDVVVVENGDSIAVSSTEGGSLTGSVQLALQDERGTLDLSTQHRVDTGAVINVVVGTTWTNIAMDSSAVLSGEATDPIGGTLQVDAYDQAAGIVDVTFTNVTLQNPSDGTICTVDGRLETFGLSF